MRLYRNLGIPKMTVIIIYFSSQQHNILAAAAAAEGRRLEELAAMSRERQYAALATDPLVRLQMAGVNPEMP